MLAGTGSGRATGISAIRKSAAKIAAIARVRDVRSLRLKKDRRVACITQTECPLRAQHFKKEILDELEQRLAWVEILAYEPDLSGPSSPQRCSQPTAKHVPKQDGSAQWAVGVIFSSTRVLVLGL